MARDSRPIPSPRGSFIEQVMPGTFEKALGRNSNVYMLFDHREDRLLCDQQTGGLSLREDNIGLYADAQFWDDEVAEKARAGQLTGWSFGFFVNGDHWNDDNSRRYLDDIDLVEVSVLDCTPAYIATSVEARSEDAYFEVRDFGEIRVIEAEDPAGDQDDPIEEPQDERADGQQDEPAVDSRARAKALITYYTHLVAEG